LDEGKTSQSGGESSWRKTGAGATYGNSRMSWQVNRRRRVSGARVRAVHTYQSRGGLLVALASEGGRVACGNRVARMKLAWVEQHDARDKKAGDDEPKRKRSVPHSGFAFGHPASPELSDCLESCAVQGHRSPYLLWFLGRLCRDRPAKEQTSLRMEAAGATRLSLYILYKI
jgi:hypothetical protein